MVALVASCTLRRSKRWLLLEYNRWVYWENYSLMLNRPVAIGAVSVTPRAKNASMRNRDPSGLEVYGP